MGLKAIQDCLEFGIQPKISRTALRTRAYSSASTTELDSQNEIRHSLCRGLFGQLLLAKVKRKALAALVRPWLASKGFRVVHLSAPYHVPSSLKNLHVGEDSQLFDGFHPTDSSSSATISVYLSTELLNQPIVQAL